MNRRSFLRNLFIGVVGFTVAPVLIKSVVNKPKANLNLKGYQHYDSGIIYAPYIPIYVIKNISMDSFKYEKYFVNRGVNLKYYHTQYISCV